MALPAVMVAAMGNSYSLPKRVGIRPPLVLVEWVDSHVIAGWQTDEPAKEPLLCRSVGWLIHNGKKVKTIAPHMSDEEVPQRCGEMTIPTCAIRRIKRLK